MPRQDFDLKTIMDIPLWEKVQDEIAKLTGTAIITVDYKGIPVTKHSRRTDFCSVIRENPVSRKRCYRCDALAGLESVRLERPYIYLCHCGIVDVAVPVMVGDRYLGAVMFGQVRLVNKDSEKAVRLVNEISSFQAEESAARVDLLEMYKRLPEMEYERIVEIASMLSAIVEYIVDSAVNRRNERETYEWLLSMENERSGRGEAEITELREPEKVNDEESSEAEIGVKKNSAIYPALVYIEKHLKEQLSMSEMARLCHLSPSYFSRLFNRETGESFANYVGRRKVECAKNLLRTTSKSVSQISNELGYVSVSHFINVFKRVEGATPTLYRQHRFR